MAIFTEFVTVPLITACPTCLSLSFFFFFQKKLIIYVLKFLSHSMKSQILNRYQRLGQCTVLCDTLLPVEVHCLFASTAVVSKTKWSAQEKTHSQELAMCWTVNCIFEPFDPLEGEVSLFFPFIYFSFRWNNQLPKHELLLFRVHETNYLKCQNRIGSENALPLSGILVLHLFIWELEQCELIFLPVDISI